LIDDIYRLYSRGTKSGGAVLKSSGSGGAILKSSGSGGNSVLSSSSGGGAVLSSSAGGGISATSSNFVEAHDMTGTPENSVGTENWGYHMHEFVVQGHDHTVTIPDHQHSVTVPNHQHSVTTPSHVHEIDIPAHVHEIDIPEHNHDIEYGIFQLDRMPTAVEIKVDGNIVPHTDINGENIDLVPYLDRDESNNIVRGWHKIEILPNDLARINANVTSQVFIQSRGKYSL
jgi:hypothetical protein